MLFIPAFMERTVLCSVVYLTTEQIRDVKEPMAGKVNLVYGSGNTFWRVVMEVTRWNSKEKKELFRKKRGKEKRPLR